MSRVANPLSSTCLSHRVGGDNYGAKGPDGLGSTKLPARGGRGRRPSAGMARRACGLAHSAAIEPTMATTRTALAARFSKTKASLIPDMIAAVDETGMAHETRLRGRISTR
jgi:hypothetical protein